MNNLSGIKAWLPEDVKRQEQLSSILIDIFKTRDFEPIEIPTIVDLSLVQKANTKFTADSFKLIDRDGTTLALRTELTQPIAKLVATRSGKFNLPIKFYYNSNVSRSKGLTADASREIKQIGVEYFSQETQKADDEIIHLLVESIIAIGLQNWRLTLTDAKIWRRIFEIYGSKNMSFEQELDFLISSNSYKYAITNEEELSIAAKAYKYMLDNDLIKFRQLAQNNAGLRVILSSNNIEEIETVLEIDLSAIKAYLKINENIVFDALQCPDLKLYTGLHINLNAYGHGRLLALGGRYDKLCEKFGSEKIPAIGFAFYLSGLLSILEQQKIQKAPAKTLKIAVTKGTLLEGAKTFLKSKGLEFEQDNPRKLILPVIANPTLGFDNIELLLVRGHDVPVYVEHGAADLGIVGSDVVLDSKAKVVKLRDLEYGQCRLCVCAKQGLYKSLSELPGYTRVATTFPNISKEFFLDKGIEAEIINLYGSVELGPLTNLSNVIVDLVASGKTLEENGLEVISQIMDCSASLIANNSSFKLYREQFLALSTEN